MEGASCCVRSGKQRQLRKGSHQQFRPSVAHVACQIHMNGPDIWITPQECVNSSLPYFKESRLMVAALDVRMSYDVTLWAEKSLQDTPDLLLSSRQLNICHMNINESLNELYGKKQCHLRNLQQCFYYFCQSEIGSKLLPCNRKMRLHFMTKLNYFFTHENYISGPNFN